MIERIIIRNFKSFDNRRNYVVDLHKNTLIIGENNSGKSTILEAINIFFNESVIDKILVPDLSSDIFIAIMLDGETYIRKYKSSTCKLYFSSANIGNLSNLSYIYISAKNIDVSAKVKEFAVAKLKNILPQDILEVFKDKAQESIDAVIDSIDDSMLVIDNGINNLVGTQKFDISNTSVKFDLTYDGIDLNAHGMGSQKTLIYALLTKSVYDNVILGIDEIENSLSISTTVTLINTIKNKFEQTIFTTHSTVVTRAFSVDDVIPLFKGTTASTIGQLYTHLGNVNQGKPFLLLEGKTDVKWVFRALEILGKSLDYHVIFGGGSSTPSLQAILVNSGFTVVSIGDGDRNVTQLDFYFSKEIIELYAEYSYLNTKYGLALTSQIANRSLLETTLQSVQKTLDDAKVDLSDDVHNILTDDRHDFVMELKTMLGI